MFEIVKEIEEILNGTGDTFAVFNELEVEQAESDETWETYDNVGVVYSNGLSMELLPGNKGMAGSLELELLLQVKDGVKTADLIIEPLTALIDNANGTLKTAVKTAVDEHGQPVMTPITYNYTMAFDYPRTDGKVEVTANGKHFVRFVMAISLTMTTALTMGDEVDGDVWLDLGTGTAVQLENIVNFILTPNVAIDAKQGMNNNTIKATVTGRKWGAQIIFKFDADNALHKALFNLCEDTPEISCTIKYRLPNDTVTASGKVYRTRQVILHDTVFPFLRGENTAVTLNLSEADDG